MNILKMTESTEKLITAKKLLTRLTKWNYVCLCYFMCLFCRTVTYKDINKMDTHNLSVCIAPSIFHKLDRPNDVESSF